ncbi:hypothetical protein OQA88_6772 [Cercophora sp. LCS_1]
MDDGRELLLCLPDGLDEAESAADAGKITPFSPRVGDEGDEAEGEVRRESI